MFFSFVVDLVISVNFIVNFIHVLYELFMYNTWVFE